MSNTSVTVIRDFLVSNVKCFEVELLTDKGNRKRRNIIISDSLNVDPQGDFNSHLVPHLDPDIHEPIYNPHKSKKGSPCRTCQGIFEINPPCPEDKCPYEPKYNGNYVYVVTKIIKDNPNTIRMLRGMYFYHMDHEIFDLILRASIRLGICCHHLFLSPSYDVEFGHSLPDSGIHSSLTIKHSAAEKKFLDAAELLKKELILNGDNKSPNKQIIQLKRVVAEARIKQMKALNKIQTLPDSSRLPQILDDYRDYIKRGDLYIPKTVITYTSPNVDGRAPKRTQKQMQEAGLR